MPELPEVESTCRGIRDVLLNQKILSVHIRESRLRWPISPNLAIEIKNSTVLSIERRAKYILIITNKGTLIIHLGMSGRLQVAPLTSPARKHDHIDFIFAHSLCLRFNDTRRFGSVLWTTHAALQHPLLINLGVEPLSTAFTGDYLFTHARQSKTLIKKSIMNHFIVVGIGNIYANEALFYAGILPTRLSNSLSLAECKKLVAASKKILRYAIKRGGTTLRDFLSPGGEKGYFALELAVYGKALETCIQCNNTLSEVLYINQRATVYCSYCQH